MGDGQDHVGGYHPSPHGGGASPPVAVEGISHVGSIVGSVLSKLGVPPLPSPPALAEVPSVPPPAIPNAVAESDIRSTVVDKTEMEEILGRWFGNCRRGSCIAVGSRRVSPKTGELAILQYTLLEIERGQILLPGIVNQLAGRGETAYITRNPVSRSAMRGDRKSPATMEQYDADRERGVPKFFSHENKYVSDLAAICIDCDVGRAAGDLTAEQAAIAVQQAALVEKTVPIPSMIGFSGRGIYVMFLLHDGQGSVPKCTKKTISEYRQVTMALSQRLSHLKPDVGISKNYGSWVKAPGTVDTNTGNRVQYIALFTGSGNAPRYSFDDFMEVLQIPNAQRWMEKQRQLESPEVLHVTEGSPPPTKPKRSGKRPEAPVLRQIREIELLAPHRGGIREGSRDKVCMVYGWCCFRLLKYDHHPNPVAGAMEMLNKFNQAHCNPPLSESECDYAFNLVKTIRSDRDKDRPIKTIRTQTLVEWLEVSRTEAEVLGFVSLKPEEAKEGPDQETLDRRRDTRERRIKVEEMIRHGATTKEIYATIGNDGKSRMLVMNRRNVLGIPNPKRSSTQVPLSPM